MNEPTIRKHLPDLEKKQMSETYVPENDARNGEHFCLKSLLPVESFESLITSAVTSNMTFGSKMTSDVKFSD